MFALLATLSFWAFLVARRTLGRRGLVLWALASALALLSHYFALFLVVPEAIWLLLIVRPRLPAALAVGAVGAVGAALIPLVVSQADGRADWISDSPLADRVKEVIKKSVTGEYDPTSNIQITVLVVVLGGGIAYGLWRARPQERRGFAVALALGAGVPAIALALDLGGQNYLVAKNVLLALPILAVAAGAALGSSGAGRVGVVAAVFACAGFLAIIAASLTDRTLRRPDMRAAAEALGPPAPGEAVVTIYHGSMPLRLYRPGSTDAGAGAPPVRELNVVLPLNRGDTEGPTRTPTPPTPPGFTHVERDERPGFTLLRYQAEPAAALDAATAAALAPGTSRFPSAVLLWP